MPTITVSKKDSFLLITLEGRLDAAGGPQFEEETASLLNESPIWIVDFTDVEFLSSAGIRSLLKTQKSLAAQQGFMTLFGLKPFVRKVMESAGLKNLFSMHEDLDAAYAHALKTGNEAKARETKTFASGSMEILAVPDATSELNIIGLEQDTRSLRCDDEQTPLQRYNMEELGVCLGLGGFGADASQAAQKPGPILSCFNCAAFFPPNGSAGDFITTDTPAETSLFLSLGITPEGDPDLVVNVRESQLFSISTLLENLQSETEQAPLFFGIGAAADVKASTTGGRSDISAARMLCVILQRRNPLPDKEADARVQALFQAFGADTNTPDTLILGLLSDAEIAPDSTPEQLYSELLSLENLREAVMLSPETLLSGVSMRIFLPQAFSSFEEKRLKIEIKDGEPLSEEAEAVVRRIFAREAGKDGVARVELIPLSGGFTSENYYAESFDRQNKRILPTVLKLGEIDLIAREERAYHDYVKRFILNNSTAIMGSCSVGETAGLRYNFLGVTGQDGKLTWLTDHYLKRPAEELLPIFDRVFTDILKPWYGQPKWESVRLYDDHNASNDFSSLFTDCQKELGISPEDPEIPCPYLGRNLPNPFHFLKYKFPKRRSETSLRYTAICHNDLNMQNILLDDNENIYIIDFSETRPVNIVSDFARLEPIMLFELPRMDDDSDLENIVRFIDGWYSVDSLKATPPLVYTGDDPLVLKAHTIMSRLRYYADTVTLFETDVVPYLLPAFQWSVCVTSYTGFDKRRMQASAYMAGIICEKLL